MKLTISMFVAIFVLLVMSFAINAQGTKNKDTWRPFSTGNGDITFEMPCKPQITETQTSIFYICETKNRTYIVAYAPFFNVPIGNVPGVSPNVQKQKEEHNRAESFLVFYTLQVNSVNSYGKIISNKNVATANVLGNDYVAKTEDGIEHGRNFGVKYKGVYGIVGIVKNGKAATNTQT